VSRGITRERQVQDHLEFVPTCPNCHGTGTTRFGVCAYCKGSGNGRPSKQIVDPLPGSTFEDIFKP
jgi:DnaJ-class molecular chaperone